MRVAYGLLTALLVTMTTAAGAAVCEPPRCVAEELAVDGEVYRFNVLLPSDYRSSTGNYPALFLLHGGTGDENRWLESSDLIAFMEDKAVIVVTPDGGLGGLVLDWHRPYETVFTQSLIPLVDSKYRTIADRAHRAIGGFSGGGFGALHLAVRHPDLFVAVGGFSGNPYDFATASPLGEAAYFGATSALDVFCTTTGGDDPGSVCDGDTGALPPEPFGDPVTNAVEYHNHSPADLALNLGGTAVYIAAGNGIPCDETDLARMLERLPLGAVEPYSYEEAIRFDSVLTRAGVAHTSDLYGCGTHDWLYWQRDLETFWRLLANGGGAFGSPAPSSFDYRSADPKFSVWDWTFEVDPKRAAEFLDVADASCKGLGLTGSGITTVETAKCFVAGDVVQLHGAVEPSGTADASGRLAFTVDLGPPHEHQQYTPEQRALEGLGGYWTGRTVTFSTATFRRGAARCDSLRS